MKVAKIYLDSYVKIAVILNVLKTSNAWVNQIIWKLLQRHIHKPIEG